MNKQDSTGYPWATSDHNKLRYCYLSSYGLSILTAIAFICAMVAIPISGANAPNGGIPYPYLDTVKQFPRDYIWQYIAMVMLFVYLANYVIIRTIANIKYKLSLTLGVFFACMATIVLIVDYYIQVNVVVISIINNELQGLALLTQYNPHGIFIALEELGYLLMIFSLGFQIPLFWNKEKKLRKISVIYLIGIAITFIGYIIISIQFGLDKKDLFEVLIISVSWLILIINSIIIGIKIQKSKNY